MADPTTFRAAIAGQKNSTGAHHGRGAVANMPGRFDTLEVDPFDDGWNLTEDLPAEKTVPTTLIEDHNRTILTHNNSPDLPFSQTINPYQGCEHGCTYCYARPSHAYWNLSPGLDFETRIFYKPQAATQLRLELSNPRYQPVLTALGANTDPYQPIERQLKITRSILEVLQEFQHPIGIITKSNLVVRDLDILAPMAEKQLVTVAISVTTLDRQLARTMEPRAPAPDRRLQAIQQLASAGVPVRVMAAPMIPLLNDCDLEEILRQASQAGARYAGYTFIRLPYEVKDLFAEWLRLRYPESAERILNRIRDSRDGALNQSQFGQRMRGTGAFADLLRNRFEVACRRLNLNRGNSDLTHRHFCRPAQVGDQLKMF